METTEFSHRFKQAIKLAGVRDTQRSLAKRLDVSGTMIWSYKNGRKLPRMEKALYIANQLNVCVEWLLQGTGPCQRNNILQEATPTYRAKRSTQAIMEFVEELSEAERKKALALLRTAFDR